LPQQALNTDKPKSIKFVPAHHKKPTNPLWKRKLASVSRWLHIYLSMVSFAVVFFFSVTGITLNHQDKFSSAQSSKQYKGAVQLVWITGANIDKLATVEHLRKTHAIHGAVADFRIEDAQLTVSFKGPGYAADAFIDRKTGKYEVNETRMGWVAIINDLHKGRDSGRSWAWVIDLSAGLLVLVSFTGIILLFYLTKKLASGLMAGFAGALVCYLVYAIWVP